MIFCHLESIDRLMWSIDDNRITMLKKDMIVIRKIDAIFYPDWSFLENYILDSFLCHTISINIYIVITDKALKI